MCLSMRTSSPQVYQRPNPQDIYYNGNIYDPKPVKEKEAKVERTPNAEASRQNFENTNPINSSGSGLQIYTGGN